MKYPSRMAQAIFLLSMVFLCGCSEDSSDDPVSPATNPMVILQPSASTVAVGGETDLALSVQNLTPPVFAITMQIRFDAAVLSCADTLMSAASGFLGSDVISFAEVADSTVHLALTRVQGQTQVEGSGALCALRLTGIASGSSTVRILPSELQFFDSLGAAVSIPDLETSSATITVQ